MNLDIYKNSRSSGRFFHKSRGFDSCKTKQQALLDISMECRNSKYYTRNYLAIEYIVLLACSCDVQFLSINTSLL